MHDEIAALAADVSLDWSPEEIPDLAGGPGASSGASEIIVAGRSREGQPIHGIRCGRGPLRVALLGGAHADEPLGPATLVALARWLRTSRGAGRVRERATFAICPHVNPDGAARNASWSRRFPCPFEEYVAHVEREAPGDDVEFGYPRSAADDARPENRAVAGFLAGGAPYSFHASLHGMAIAEGAWFLLDRGHAAATVGLRAALTLCCERLGVGLHDQDRRGEKGFTRLGPGFATTPTSTAMREFFLRQGDAATAALFRPSSMEFVAALGGAPLCTVSEIPLYTVTPTPPGAALGANFAAARDGLLALRGAPPEKASAVAADLRRRFGLAPVPVATAARLLLALVFLGSGLVSRDEFLGPS